MSNYKEMRSKRNADLMNAIANVKKDLYDRKQIENSLKLKINQQNKIVSSPANSANLLFKKSNSLKDLNKFELTNSKPNSVSSAKSNIKLRPLSGLLRQQNNNQFDDIGLFDLDNDESNSHRKNSGLNRKLTDDRVYLNASPRNKDGLLASKANRKTLQDLEEEIMLKIKHNDTNNIYEADFSQYGLVEIKNLTKLAYLKKLDFSCNRIKKIEHLNYKFLIELMLFANEIEVVENLQNLPELLSLQMQSNQIKKLNKGLFFLKKLEYLRIDQNKIEEIEVSDLASCSNLIYLNISHNKIESLTFVNYLPNLEELDASFNMISRLDELDAIKCRKLMELDLSNNKLNDEMLSPLENFRNLITLKIANNSLKSIRNVAKIKTLRNLDISNNEITSIKELKNLKDLETLNFTNNKINEWFEIMSLVQLNQLVEISIDKNPISETKSREDFKKALPNLQFINSIKIDDSVSGVSLDVEINKPTSKIDNLAMVKMDLKMFEQQMEMFNQNFIKRFNEINERLQLMTNKDEESNNDEAKNSTITSPRLAINGERKKSSKNRLLFDALSFSKQLDM